MARWGRGANAGVAWGDPAKVVTSVHVRLSELMAGQVLWVCSEKQEIQVLTVEGAGFIN